MERKWAGAEAGEAQGDDILRMMQFNVLADGMEESFRRVPPECLPWSFRYPLILQLIVEQRPHVVCLQELNHFRQLKRDLAEYGYKGDFFVKKSSPCVSLGYPPDGTAIFYQSSVLQKTACHKQYFLREDENGLAREGSQGFLCTSFQLQSQPTTHIHVLATHLKAKPAFEDIRHSQAQQLLEHVESLPQSDHICILGDFNAEPDGKTLGLVQQFGFRSAYEIVLGEEVSYTTRKIRSDLVEHTIDYILVLDKSRMLPLRVLCPPTQPPELGLPHPTWPSDHLSLVADIQLLS